ncbi:MAG TPA: hypothetical protein VHE79_11405, partial [Spirochaetia bacterium]
NLFQFREDGGRAVSGKRVRDPTAVLPDPGLARRLRAEYRRECFVWTAGPSGRFYAGHVRPGAGFYAQAASAFT